MLVPLTIEFTVDILLMQRTVSQFENFLGLVYWRLVIRAPKVRFCDAERTYFEAILTLFLNRVVRRCLS